MRTKSTASLEELWDVENQFSALAGSATGKIEQGWRPKASQTEVERVVQKVFQKLMRKNTESADAVRFRLSPPTNPQSRTVAASVEIGVLWSTIRDSFRRVEEEYKLRGEKREFDILMSDEEDAKLSVVLGLSKSELKHRRHDLTERVKERVLLDMLSQEPSDLLPQKKRATKSKARDGRTAREASHD